MGSHPAKRVNPFLVNNCMGINRTGTVEERFLRNVIKGENENDCWGWKGYKDTNGYPQLSDKGKEKMGSRISYTIFNGGIGEDLCVCHSCDNPICTNPKHLWLGTHLENMRDRDLKGRRKTKINLIIANKIREEYKQGLYTYNTIADKYGIKQGTVGDILHNRIWKI